MDENVRLAYLEAMGIENWQVRFSQFEPETEELVIENEIIQNVDDWEFLKTQVQNCTQCHLCQTRTQTVFGSGNPRAKWLIIGEAPGQQEDEQGLPFVGEAGLLLTEMLRAIGLNRETDVFIANILKCRPPQNRDPQPDEIKQCYAFLEKQIQLIQPTFILAIGRIAAHTLLKTNQPLSKLRRTLHYLESIPMIVIYHPAYLLRSLSEKRKAWQDLQFAFQTFHSLA